MNKIPLAVVDEIIKHVKDRYLFNGELLNSQAWIDEIKKAKNEGRKYIELSSSETKSNLPHIINL